MEQFEFWYTDGENVKMYNYFVKKVWQFKKKATFSGLFLFFCLFFL